ncbi:MAG: DNA polymerase III subunit alpha [Hyphomicrobiales bacterium]|nr:DNA polymerase III subunit alpha [Hyphomicrobiales bacterium]
MAAASEQTLFIHLRVHSAYSLLEGALPIKTLVKLAKGQAMPALALTDSNNLFGALEFSETLAEAGIQPIVGCTLTLGRDEETGGSGNGRPPGETVALGNIALLAKSAEGYANLMELSSQAFLEHMDAAVPHVTLADIAAHNEGLIALTGGSDGPVDRALAGGDAEVAASLLGTLKETFADRLYVELQRHGQADERRVEPKLVDLAYDLELPLVATNQAFFASRDDFEAHDALICIAEGSYLAVDDRRQLSPEHYFKSPSEMAETFSDLPEAIENTVEIARRCAFRPETRAPILPQFVADSGKDGGTGEADELRRQAEEGLRARLAAQGTAPNAEESTYWERLAFELDVIVGMDYPGYFLIVADFIKWAKQHNIPVGPGRGSGAGSLVAWALTITDLDPIRFGLLFERFLNPERVSMPDFDIDFCQERRDEVIRYVQERYGADKVAQIITFGKLQARAVLRDVGRVLQMPYGQVDRLCKLVPFNPANPVTLPEAIDGEPRLQEARDAEPIVAKLLDIGQRLEGLYRHASTHAAGVVIGDRPLKELVPLYCDPRATLPATQFNMKWVEPAGLVKFDFLGLKTLTVIETAVDLLGRENVELDMARLALDDGETYALLSRAETVGVFQLESSGMREALRKLRPDRFEDIIAMVALYRPGPMANIETFINRKHGREEPDYLHPLIRPILEETYGVIIYQEQVMEIAQVLSGYSLGEADLLRRAMGKKIQAEMDQQKSRFIEGALANDVEKSRAEYIFELVARFAGYGFNKSHAAAYALLAYQTAYLKANHPVAFLAASMTLDMGNTDKLNTFVQEAKRMDIAIEPPSVNASEVGFSPSGQAIRYALAALKNMGRQAAEQIFEERQTNGAFEDLADFARRLNPRVINKRAIETLAAAGALDTFSRDRARLHGNADRILGAANRSSEDQSSGQNDLFSGKAAHALDLRPCEPWVPIDLLGKEFDAVGFFLTGHPLDEYRNVLPTLNVESWKDFSARAQAGSTTGFLAGTVTYRQERKSQRGNRFAFVGFSDQTGQFEAIVFSETLAAHRETLEPGLPVLVGVEAEPDEDAVKLRVQKVEALDVAASKVQTGLKVFMRDPASLTLFAKRLSPEGRGTLRLVLRLDDMDREVEFTLPGGYDTSPAQASAFGAIDGVEKVEAV